MEWTICDDSGQEDSGSQTVQSDPAGAAAELLAGRSFSDPGVHDELCQYSYTLYSSGGKTGGDSIYGVDNRLGAYAFSHATVAGGGVHKTTSAFAIAGHRLLFGGPLATVQGKIVFPWHIVGEIATSTQFSGFPPATTSALATTELRIGIFDEVTGNAQSALVARFERSGNSIGTHSAHYTNPNTVYELPITYVTGRTYRPYLRIDTFVDVVGNVANPLLLADARANFFRPGTPSYGSYLSFIRYWFTIPNDYTMDCGQDVGGS